YLYFFFFSSRRRHTRFSRDWSSDVCSSDLVKQGIIPEIAQGLLAVDAIESQVSHFRVNLGGCSRIRENLHDDLVVVVCIGHKMIGEHTRPANHIEVFEIRIFILSVQGAGSDRNHFEFLPAEWPVKWIPFERRNQKKRQRRIVGHADSTV